MRDKIKRVVQENITELLKKENVVGAAPGTGRVGGADTGLEAVVVFVAKKVPLKSLKRRDRVPEKVDGVPTDVVEVGDLEAQFHRGRNRPALGGDSVGHYQITAGTLGARVSYGTGQHGARGIAAILSNNHVLANSNDGELGDPILQPGPHDGGVLKMAEVGKDEIGVLLDYVPITFHELPSACRVAGFFATVLNGFARLLGRETRLRAMVPATPNLVDAAVAYLHREDDALDEIRTFGRPAGIGDVEPDDLVYKYGRTTHDTEGQVLYTDATVRVGFGGTRFATFEDQLILTHMSEPGDSGSVILDSSNRIVGLLFAGSNQVTIANKAEHVWRLLNLE